MMMIIIIWYTVLVISNLRPIVSW